MMMLALMKLAIYMALCLLSVPLYRKNSAVMAAVASKATQVNQVGGAHLTVPKYGKCGWNLNRPGDSSWFGCCDWGLVCAYQNPYFSMCLPPYECQCNYDCNLDSCGSIIWADGKQMARQEQAALGGQTGSPSVHDPPQPHTSAPTGNVAGHYQQCGRDRFDRCYGSCAPGLVCSYANPWWAMCLTKEECGQQCGYVCDAGSQCPKMPNMNCNGNQARQDWHKVLRQWKF